LPQAAAVPLLSSAAGFAELLENFSLVAADEGSVCWQQQLREMTIGYVDVYQVTDVEFLFEHRENVNAGCVRFPPRGLPDFIRSPLQSATRIEDFPLGSDRNLHHWPVPLLFIGVIGTGIDQLCPTSPAAAAAAGALD
jgi:hypothetical protein